MMTMPAQVYPWKRHYTPKVSNKYTDWNVPHSDPDRPAKNSKPRSSRKQHIPDTPIGAPEAIDCTPKVSNKYTTAGRSIIRHDEALYMAVKL